MYNHYKGFDFGASLDEIIQAAREFGQKFKEMGPEKGPFGFETCFDRAFDRGTEGHHFQSSVYFYPPANIYSTRDGSLVLEFAFAGLDESAVSVTFQGDYLVLSARVAQRETEADASDFARHGFRPRDIDRQKYRVPADDYLQDEAKAVFKNGVLTVTVPPRNHEGEGIKIEIVKEGM